MRYQSFCAKVDFDFWDTKNKTYISQWYEKSVHDFLEDSLSIIVYQKVSLPLLQTLEFSKWNELDESL